MDYYFRDYSYSVLCFIDNSLTDGYFSDYSYRDGRLRDNSRTDGTFNDSRNDACFIDKSLKLESY